MLEANYIRAYEIMYGKWFSIDQCDSSEDDHISENHISYSIVLPSDKLSAEEYLIKKQEFENLSNEAKEIIDLVLSLPLEFTEILYTPVRKRLTKKSIYEYFKTVWKSKFITSITIKEITDWVKKL